MAEPVTLWSVDDAEQLEWAFRTLGDMPAPAIDSFMHQIVAGTWTKPSGAYFAARFVADRLGRVCKVARVGDEWKVTPTEELVAARRALPLPKPQERHPLPQGARLVVMKGGRDG